MQVTLCHSSAQNPAMTPVSLKVLRVATTWSHHPHQHLLLPPLLPNLHCSHTDPRAAPRTPRHTPTFTSLHQLLSVWSTLPPENFSVRPALIALLDPAPCHPLHAPYSYHV